MLKLLKVCITPLHPELVEFFYSPPNIFQIEDLLHVAKVCRFECLYLNSKFYENMEVFTHLWDPCWYLHTGLTILNLRMFVPTLKMSQNLQIWQVLECNKKDMQTKSGSLNTFSFGVKHHIGYTKDYHSMCLQEGVLITSIKVIWQFWCETLLLGITIIFLVSIFKNKINA